MIPVTNPRQKIVSGLKGKYSFEDAWKQATTMPKPRIETDPRWKEYFAKKQKTRDEVIAKSKEPGQLASERFLTEEVNGIRMTPEQARSFKQKQADLAYETENKIDANKFRELLQPENINKAKEEYLAQLPKDQMWAQQTVNTKYGGTFSDARGSGFDQWFSDNYLSKIKKEENVLSDGGIKKYQDLLNLINTQGQAKFSESLKAPREDYLTRGTLSNLPKTPEEKIKEKLETSTSQEKRKFQEELGKEAPVFTALTSMGYSSPTRSIESFLSGGARKSRVFGPTAFKSAFGSGLGKGALSSSINNYPTYGRG